MTRLRVPPRTVAGWSQGLIEDAEPGTLATGTIGDGENFVPSPAGRLRTRGGSRIVQTLHDAVADAELDHVCAISPFTTVGALVIGWSDTQNKHYAYRLTSDMAFYASDEAASRTELANGWTNASSPARPVMAEVWEKMFIADAVTSISARNVLLACAVTGTITSRTFEFGSDGEDAAAPKPYCLEEYNGVLFIAGYGTEDSGDLDRPEFLRHSFLGKSPDAADGFDVEAWALIGSKGQRITALRKGRSILLVAKENEFYRVSGFGRAYAGWQYQIDRVENTQGLGIANPKALTFAKGFWWGIGASGPLRTDGYTVQSLVGPRKSSWRGIDKLADAWVTYHPERNLILFGLHPVEAASGRSDTFPWVVWAWDIERSVWQPNHKYGADLFHASAVTSTTAATAGPDGAPSSPAVVSSSPSTSGYTAGWTNGDTSATTEFWEKTESGGTWTEVAVIAAGTATYPRTGRTNYTSYYWRVRHLKDGLRSAWSADAGTLAQTLMTVPGCAAEQIEATSNISVVLTQNADGANLEVYRQVDGGGFSVWNTYSSRPSGTFTVVDSSRSCEEVVQYKARSKDLAWPTTTTAFSSVSEVDLTGDCF